MYYRKRPLWTAAQAPRFVMRSREQRGGSPTFIMNIASYNRLASPFSSVTESRYSEVAVKFKNPEDKPTVQAFVRACRKAPGLPNSQRSNMRFFNYYDDTETLAGVQTILDAIFSVIIVITMILCLFSLCSSMGANLLDQTKEIGILRAMGFTKTRI